MFKATVISRSVSHQGIPITSMELTFPRSILAEFNTHSMIRRNASSSRAIPISKQIERVQKNPFIPNFRRNGKGMQGFEYLVGEEKALAEREWLLARDRAISGVNYLTDVTYGLNVHKQYAARLLEPWMWCTIIATATDWDNLFHQRISPAAEPCFAKIASMAYDAMQEAPAEVGIRFNGWHLPYITEEERVLSMEMAVNRNEQDKEKYGYPTNCDFEDTQLDILCKVSAAKCARVSYIGQNKERLLEEDLDLFVSLVTNGHWSPLEHVVRPAYRLEQTFYLSDIAKTFSMDTSTGRTTGEFDLGGDKVGYCGPYQGWSSFRNEFSNSVVKNYTPCATFDLDY